MALELDNSNGLKHKTLTGVFQGQVTPLKIGAKAFDLRPNYIGIYKGEDSLSINAYFDPAASRLMADAQRRFDTINQIGYVQVGQFFINNRPLPLKLHQKYNLYPSTKALHSSFLHPYTWVDICEKNSDDQVVPWPYYAMWPLKDNAAYSWDKFFKHPQEYGGLTKFPLPAQPATKDYLCASMSSEADLSSGNLEGVDIKRLLDKIPLSQFNFIDTKIPLGELPGQDLRATINRLTVINRQVIPDLAAGTLANELANEFWYSGDRSRLYIQYISEVKARGGRVVRSLQIILLEQHPENPGKAACAQISDYFLNLKEEIPANSIDLIKVDEKVKEMTTITLPFGGSTIELQTNLGLPDKPMVISYRFFVFPCTISKTETEINILKYEGFEWEVSRLYDPVEGWSESIQGSVGKCWGSGSLYFNFELEKYFQKITGNRNVKVNFPFLGFYYEPDNKYQF